MKSVKIKFQVEIDIDKKGNYKLFGLPSHICPEHFKTNQDIQECFLDNLAAHIQWFGVVDLKGLTNDAKRVKKKILKNTIIEVSR